MPTRHVSFAGRAITVRADTPELAGLVEFLFGHVVEDRSVPQDAALSVRCSADGGGGFELRVDDQVVARAGSVADIAVALADFSLYHLVRNNAAGLLLHAAAVSRTGRAILLPGTSGAGKSSLAAWLTAQGFHYLSDELAFVAAGGRDLDGFARPIHIKQPGMSAMAELIDWQRHRSEILRGTQVTMLPATLLNPSSRFAPAPVAAIVFPCYTPAGPMRFEPLSPARAALALMECLANARNLSGHGFDQATDLARRTVAFRLHYSAFEQLDGWPEQLLQ